MLAVMTARDAPGAERPHKSASCRHNVGILVFLLDVTVGLQPGGQVPNTFRPPANYQPARLVLPTIGIGTMAWGDPRRGWRINYNSTDLKEAFEVLGDAGVRLYDTSEVYGYQGVRLFEASEQLLASLIAKSPADPPLVSTKFMPVPWTNLLVGGGVRIGRQAVVEAVRNSIARLGVGSIDLYSLHAPLPYMGGRQALYEGLAECYDLGLCRGIGVCNFNARQVHEAYHSCRQLGVPLVSNQFRYSLMNIERELDGTLETCLELGLTPVAHTPRAGGLLSARYAHALAKRGGRRGRVGRFDSKHLLVMSHLFEAMSAIAEAHTSPINPIAAPASACTESQVALRFAMAKGCVPLPGVNNVEQARDVAAALDWELDLREMEMLSEQALTLHARRKELPWLKGL